MATTDDLTSYYVDLLVLQYRSKTKARGFIDTVVRPVIMDQLPDSVQNAFNLESAVGVQLDVIGDYVGASRSALSFSGLITLTDDEFRILIKMRLIQNNAGSSLAEIQDLLFTFFPDVIRVFDYANMHMSYFFSTSLGTQQLAEVFVRQGLLPKPMGVELGALLYLPTLAGMFSMMSYPIPTLGTGSGFNTYAAYETDRPWLKYADALIFE